MKRLINYIISYLGGNGYIDMQYTKNNVEYKYSLKFNTTDPSPTIPPRNKVKNYMSF